jgi:mRNA interferase RelE/StbE
MPDDYRVQLIGSARREMARFRQPLTGRILAALRALSSSPRPRGCRKLSGYESRFRVRAGDYRIIYEINDDDRLVLVYGVRHRSKAYDHRQAG